MEIVELFPGCCVPYALFCRVRALLGLLVMCLAVFALDRSCGIMRSDRFAALPAELTDVRALPLATPPAGPDARTQLAYLDRFFRGRAQAPDLARYAATVAPPAVRLARLSAISSDPMSGLGRGGASLRAEGRAPDAERLHSFVESLRVMAPTATADRAGPAGEGFGFRIATADDARAPEGP